MDYWQSGGLGSRGLGTVSSCELYYKFSTVVRGREDNTQPKKQIQRLTELKENLESGIK